MKHFSSARISAAQSQVDVVDREGHVRKLQDIESDVLRAALIKHEGSVTEAALRLGIGRSTFYRRLPTLNY
jgi:transcriptional regulator of acetoin/glycerol metabolism